MSLTTPTFSTAQASTSGGIGYFTGTNVDISMTSFSIDTTKANNNYGGGFALLNTGTAKFVISTG
jgi:hypothetical protein